MRNKPRDDQPPDRLKGHHLSEDDSDEAKLYRIIQETTQSREPPRPAKSSGERKQP